MIKQWSDFNAHLSQNIQYNLGYYRNSKTETGTGALKEEHYNKIKSKSYF